MWGASRITNRTWLVDRSAESDDCTGGDIGNGANCGSDQSIAGGGGGVGSGTKIGTAATVAGVELVVLIVVVLAVVLCSGGADGDTCSGTMCRECWSMF